MPKQLLYKRLLPDVTICPKSIFFLTLPSNERNYIKNLL